MFFSLNFQIFLQKNDLFRHFLSFLSIRGNLSGLYRRLVLDVQMPCTGSTNALYLVFKPSERVLGLLQKAKVTKNKSKHLELSNIIRIFVPDKELSIIKFKPTGYDEKTSYDAADGDSLCSERECSGIPEQTEG
jgi:hypothetical protein